MAVEPQRVQVLSLWKGLMWSEYVPPRPTLQELAEEIAEVYGIAVHELRGPSREWSICHPRQHFMAIAYAESGKSLPQIGRFLRRHHTTVLTGLRAHKCRNHRGHD